MVWAAMWITRMTQVIDPLTAAGAGLTVLGSRDLLNKVLGPTADYLGGEIKNLVERCNVNLDNILRIALNKLGDRAEEQGSVSPRVLKHVYDEGRFCEDSLTAEYLGGVLASSKTEVGRDDRGLTYLSVVNSLSTYQLRTHYLIYSALLRQGNPFRQDVSYWCEQDWITLYLAERDLVAAMEYSHREDHAQISYHAFLGLQMKRLSEGGLRAVLDDVRAPAPHRVVWPTQYGFELFVWAMGLGGQRFRSFFDVSVDQDFFPWGFAPLGIALGKVLCWHEGPGFVRIAEEGG